jgi:uncharacterized protein (DUF1697 family)
MVEEIQPLVKSQVPEYTSGMPRYIAFLRAINVGGHTVKMTTLRQLFESFGLSDVETFIASGNVIFQTPDQDRTALESMIACGLQDALGYEVATFIRTGTELAQIVSFPAFPRSKLSSAASFNIAFLPGTLDDTAGQKLLALRTEIDDFAFHASEIYWLCLRRQSESTFSNAVLEKTLGIKSTLRGMNTVTELAARFAH